LEFVEWFLDGFVGVICLKASKIALKRFFNEKIIQAWRWFC